MHFQTIFLGSLVFQCLSATLLVSYSAAKGDPPSALGTLNLQTTRENKPPVKGNTPDLYIEPGTDAKGTKALHFHRAKGYIRAEYHSLKGKTAKDQTYYIGYSFSLAELQQSLMIWQFKEYSANNAKDGGANIPLALEIVDSKLQFQYQSSHSAPRAAQWTKAIQPNTRYSVAIIINTSSPGWVELYFDGKSQGLGPKSVSRLPAITFPGQADPKFGAYRGEEVVIDTFVYQVQIGTSMADIKEAGGF